MASKSKNGIEAANGKFRFVFRANGEKQRGPWVDSHKEAVSLFQDTARKSKDPDVRAFAQKMLPKLKEHKRVTLTTDQLNRLVGKYALSADIVLTVTLENGRLFIRENAEEKQEYFAENPSDFYSATSTDECSFKPETGPAQVLVLHLDNGQNSELKRVP